MLIKLCNHFMYMYIVVKKEIIFETSDYSLISSDLRGYVLIVF